MNDKKEKLGKVLGAQVPDRGTEGTEIPKKDGNQLG